MNKRNSDNSEVGEKEHSEKEVPSIIKKNIKSLLKQGEKSGLSKKDIIKILNGE